MSGQGGNAGDEQSSHVSHGLKEEEGSGSPVAEAEVILQKRE